MEEDAAVIYGVEARSRALAAQSVPDSELIRFLIGTQSFRGAEERGSENQVHLVEFDEETNTTSKNVFMHSAGEVWHIASCPSNPTLITTCYNKIMLDTKAEMHAALWRLPIERDGCLQPDEDAGTHGVELVCHFDGSDGGGGSGDSHIDTRCVLWHPGEESSSVVTLCENRILHWDVTDCRSGSSAKLKQSGSLEGKGQPRFTSGRWNPHHNCHQIATTNDTCIRGWDLRSMTQTFVIENAHGQLARDVDFNPNKQYYLASCGDDCKAKIWDTRKATEALKVLDQHSHWVWSVRYSHFHDQLILTSSSDGRVVLTNVQSLSSEPYGRLLDDEDGDREDGAANAGGSKDGPSIAQRAQQDMAGTPAGSGGGDDHVVCVYEEHEDSVYAAEWSPADPWVFASLSYDGRLVISRVPRAEKYKILL